MTEPSTFSIAAQREDVADFGDRFEAYCAEHAVPISVMRAFQVVFDEVLTNIVDYGFDKAAHQRIEVRLSHTDQELRAEIIDPGTAFDPLRDAEPPDLELDLEQRPIGGLGIHLMRTLMDSVRYERKNDYNHLHLSKRFEPSSEKGTEHAQGQ